MIHAAAVAAAGGLALLALAPAARAQTWGQPVYVDARGWPVGGGPLSEVETRAYVETGRWADGYSDRPHIYVPVPAPAYGAPYRSDRYGHGRSYGYGYRNPRRYGPSYGYGYRSSGSRVGYRDEWGYQDDRPPSTLSRRYSGHDGGHRRECGCGDVYLYDR